jgi:hypothetical protein
MRGSASLLALALIAPGDPSGVSELEREAGWVDLFDGQSLGGWHTFGEQGVRTDGWEVVDGCLHLPAGAKGGDLVADGEYGDFELELEWKVATGTNSGIKYRVPETAGASAMLGPECQVLDDPNNPEGGDGAFSAGALYALYEPREKRLEPTGEFNRVRIAARGERIEHWLNDLRVVECSVGGYDWESRRKASKFAPYPDFARGRGRIGLQDHGGEVWFRKIRVRDLEHLPGKPVELFDGKSLAGWKPLGDARYSVDDGCILGEVGGGGHSFLVTERTFGDFLLEVEVKTELPGNSGIQIRSHVNVEQRVYGYQVEIDPSDRRWSGGIYDEGRRRDWLDNKLATRSAFVPGEWNEYRIECLGPWIRTWINGVPAADVLDSLDLEGFIGLQVHSGHDTRVRWRNFRMQDLGRRAWKPVASTQVASLWSERDLRWETEDPLDNPMIRCELMLDPLTVGYRLQFALDPVRRWNGDTKLPYVKVEGRDETYPLGWEAEARRREIEVLLHGGRCALSTGGFLLMSDRVPSRIDAQLPRLQLFHGGGLTLVGLERLGPPEP